MRRRGLRGVRIVALAVALACLAAPAALGSHVKKDLYGNVIHKPDVSGEVSFVFGDWMGNETFRSAFRARVTDNTSSSWQWAGSVATSTTSSSGNYCSVPNPISPLRAGIFDACVGDYASYFTSLGYGSGTTSMTQITEIDYRDGSAHLRKGRMLVDAGRSYNDWLRLHNFCKNAGYLMGLAWTSDQSSCMSGYHHVPNGHDHAQVDAIYNGHDDTWQD